MAALPAEAASHGMDPKAIITNCTTRHNPFKAHVHVDLWMIFEDV